MRKTGYTSSLAKEGGWTCKCGQNFRTRALLNVHKKECKIIQDYKALQGHHWKKTYVDKDCPFCGSHFTTTLEGFKNHIRCCKKNPNRVQGGHKNSEETKKKISEGMKKAHAEGRAHNIGECRWNNQPSYPEQWFMKMMENEFNSFVNINYTREYPFHKFSLDFAWPERKLCIEIDGEQHDRFKEQKKRDIEKDHLLKEDGWKELRVKWIDIYNHPKDFIRKVKDFLQL